MGLKSDVRITRAPSITVITQNNSSLNYRKPIKGWVIRMSDDN